MIQNKTEYINKIKEYKTNLGIIPSRFTMRGEDFNALVDNLLEALEDFNNEIEQLKVLNTDLEIKVSELEKTPKAITKVVYRKR